MWRRPIWRRANRGGDHEGMPVETKVPLNEYLDISYRPDCDYLEGELLERNAGEWDHSRLQMALAGYLFNRDNQWGILVVTSSGYK